MHFLLIKQRRDKSWRILDSKISYAVSSFAMLITNHIQLVGPLSGKQWVTLHWWADCPWRLWLRRAGDKEGSVWQSSKCHHLLFIFARTETVPSWPVTDALFERIISGINIHLINRMCDISLLYRYVFFLDPCNIDFINRKINSIALCVSKCPAGELKTYSDLKQFALNNGEEKITATFSYSSCVLTFYMLINVRVGYI